MAGCIRYVCTYWPQGYRGSSQTYQAAVAGVGLVDSIGVLMAELVHDLCYPVVVLGSQCIPDEAFELERAALALVIELVIEGFGDIGVHGEVEWSRTLHGAAARVSHLALYCGRGSVEGLW